jgi:carboxypeptidase T
MLIFLNVNISSTISGSEDTKDHNPINYIPYTYHNYSTMTKLLLELEENNSDIMSMTSIGTTYEGRNIWMIKLSDNVNENEDEPGVLLMGAHHGNEKPSYEVLIYFIDYIINKYRLLNIDDDGDGKINEDIFDGYDNDQDGLTDEDPLEDRVRDTLNDTQIFIIPMVNPDGVEYEWRKNRAPNYGPSGDKEEITSYGVDLNRNYGYRWNIPYFFPEQYHLIWLTEDSSWTYRGEEPFCENETKAIKNFVESNNIVISLSYHDYGEWMIFPWMHTSRHVQHEAIFRSIGYNISQINKYELRIYGQFGTREYIIPHFCGTPGSSENWLYGEHGIIAYTIELCRRRPERIAERVIDACWKHVGVNLYVCERAQTVEKEKSYTLGNNQHNLLVEFELIKEFFRKYLEFK